MQRARPFEEVTDRQLTHARALMSSGYGWEGLDRSQQDHVRQITDLTRAYVDVAADWEIPAEAGAVFAQLNGGPVISAAVIGVADFEGRTIGTVLTLATDPEHRGQGLGMVTLRMAAQYLTNAGHAPQMVYGSCDPRRSRFYARAGFNVSDPHAPLMIPGATAAVASSHPRYTAWFYTFFDR